MTETRDIAMFPSLVEFFVAPILFVISLMYNALVIFVASKIWKLKTKMAGIAAPLVAHTLIVGVLELASIYALQIIMSQRYQLLDFDNAAIGLYAALSFAEIFLTFKFVTARMMRLEESDADRYGLVMGIATNPVAAILILALLLGLL